MQTSFILKRSSFFGCIHCKNVILLWPDVLKATHQEAVERVHVVHEGDEAEDRGGVHPQRERGHQSNPGKKGE